MIVLTPALAELAPSIGGLIIALAAWIVYRHEAAKVAAQRQARTAAIEASALATVANSDR